MNTAKTPNKLCLLDALPPHQTQQASGVLRWRATVPLATNPFLLADFIQLSFIGAAIVLCTLLTGSWFTEGSIAVADIWASVTFTAWVFAAMIFAFIVLSLLCFNNRYFAMFCMDTEGVYTEGCRGTDQRKAFLHPRIRPYPVLEPLHGSKPKGRHLPWSKVTYFVDIPTMRVIHLKRGCWHMMRLYSPDMATHTRVVAYLNQHFSAPACGEGDSEVKSTRQESV